MAGLYKWPRSLLQDASFYLMKGTSELDPGSLKRKGAALTTPGAASFLSLPPSRVRGEGEPLLTLQIGQIIQRGQRPALGKDLRQRASQAGLQLARELNPDVERQLGAPARISGDETA
jgi:hypothetical protein